MRQSGSQGLEVEPCLDSDSMARKRRRELDIPWEDAVRIGRETIRILAAGGYRAASGGFVNLAASLNAAISGKLSVPPDMALPLLPAPRFDTTRVQVANETTLGAARRLLGEGDSPLALNFANGINPGGGFLSGARAQEEGLCRSSGLYPTLEGDPMYAAHARRPRPDSSAWCILSPEVPVLRDDSGALLGTAWSLSFVTCAAPVASHLDPEEARSLMAERIERVLEVCAAYGYESLVLGAWGCGAFGNDPAATAQSFMESLAQRFRGRFSRVIFAIADWSPERRFLGPFRDAAERMGLV